MSDRRNLYWTAQGQDRYRLPEKVFGDSGVLSDIYELRWEQVSDRRPVGEAAGTAEENGVEIGADVYRSLQNTLNPTPRVIRERKARGEEVQNLIAGIVQGNTGAVSGFKPSGPAHFGHYQTAWTLSSLQEAGIEVYVPVADVEALNDGYGRDHVETMAADNLLDWGAAGLNLDYAHVYLQGEEDRLRDGKDEIGTYLGFEDVVDAYGMEKIVENPAFISVGLNQVSDLVLPQHDSFGKEYSFTVAGSDQAGHMQMTGNLVGSVVNSADTYIESVPAGLYCPKIKGLRRDDETAKASSSIPDTSIYIGPGWDGSRLSERIDQAITKIEAAADAGSDQLVESAEDHLWVLDAEDTSDDPVTSLKQVLPGFLEDHQERRRDVMQYAVARANGGRPEPPRFWPGNPDARVPEDERNETEWYDTVAAMDGEIVI